ncbi:MAG: hypothetical protein KC620_24680, partial [Myxococcales bacterium]|nr:hypothetical protein [Myxococcales bacterium]
MNALPAPLQRLAALLGPWTPLAIATLGAVCLVAGVFAADFSAAWLGAIVALAVFGAVAWDARRRFAVDRKPRLLGDYEGPLLWVVATWLLMRLGGPLAGDLTVLGAALIAWLVAAFPRQIAAFAVGAAVVLEVGLTVRSAQTWPQLGLHLALYGAAALGLSVFARSEIFRQRLETEREKHDQEVDKFNRARDFGLLTAQAPVIRELPHADARPTIGRATLDFLTESFTLQLDILRNALGLTTAAVLWKTPDGLMLRGSASTRGGLLPGPFPAGLG